MITYKYAKRITELEDIIGDYKAGLLNDKEFLEKLYCPCHEIALMEDAERENGLDEALTDTFRFQPMSPKDMPDFYKE